MTVACYENALVAMERLLRRTNVTGWADWMLQDLRDWRTSKDTAHHRHAYGGMGSFNDVIICRQNGHAVSEEQEPWVNELFGWIKALLFHLAKDPDVSQSAAEWARYIGRHSSSLVAFVGGELAPDSMRGFFSEKSVKLHGICCLNCGYAMVSRRGIENFIAQRVVPGLIFAAAEKKCLEQVVDLVLSMNVPGLQHWRTAVHAAVEASGVPWVEAEEARPASCPRCGRDQLAAYRWVVQESGDLRFSPDPANLPPIRIETIPTLYQLPLTTVSPSPKQKPWWQFW